MPEEQKRPPVTITLKQLLLIIGGTLAAIGLVLGLMPISVDGTSCGSAFIGNDDAMVQEHLNAMQGRELGVAAECDDATSSRRSIALALVIPGALLLTGGALVGAKPSSSTTGPIIRR